MNMGLSYALAFYSLWASSWEVPSDHVVRIPVVHQYLRLRENAVQVHEDILEHISSAFDN